MVDCSKRRLYCRRTLSGTRRIRGSTSCRPSESALPSQRPSVLTHRPIFFDASATPRAEKPKSHGIRLYLATNSEKNCSDGPGAEHQPRLTRDLSAVAPAGELFPTQILSKN
jgi:hypothetical protein